MSSLMLVFLKFKPVPIAKNERMAREEMKQYNHSGPFLTRLYSMDDI